MALSPCIVNLSLAAAGPDGRLQSFMTHVVMERTVFIGENRQRSEWMAGLAARAGTVHTSSALVHTSRGAHSETAVSSGLATKPDG